MQINLNNITNSAVKSTLFSAENDPDLQGYFLLSNYTIQPITLLLTETPTSLLDLYRVAVNDVDADLPSNCFCFKPLVNITIDLIQVPPGVYRIGGTSSGLENEFERREGMFETFTSISRLPAINFYFFIADSSSGTMSGFFTNYLGIRTGDVWEGTVTTTEAVSFQDLYGSPIPVDAVGVIINTTTDICFDISASPVGTKANLLANKSKFPVVQTGKNIAIGRIA
jgi:hypothetical protein